MIRTAAMAILLATSFMSHAAEEAKSKADPAKGKVIAETVCVACHGADGNSPASANPHLAQQGEEYIYKQLKNFKAVDGKPAARVNPIMGGMVAALSDDDMKNLAAWFASQKATPAVAKDESKIALGQKLWRQGDFKKGIPACTGCHGPAGAGNPDAGFPSLKGQHAAYLEKTLTDYHSGARANDPNAVMRQIAGKLTEAEISALAEHLSTLK